MKKGLQVLLLLFLFVAVCKPMNAEAAGEAVKITSQPKDVIVKEGVTASATVKATGDGLKYQWYYTSNGTTGSTFYKSSITNAIYSTTMNSNRAGRKVYCVVTDKYGNKVKTDIAILNMEGMVNTVKITGQPTDVTVAAGATASATVKATGDDLKYQWYYTSNGSSNIFYKSSTTKATYSTVMNAERVGRKIYCVITDRYGNKAKSNTVTLNIKGNNQPLKIVSQPKSVTVAEGALAVATVETTGDGLKYQWYYTSNGDDGTFYKSSTTGATYSVVMNAGRAGRKIYCVVTDRYGNTARTETVTLMLQPLKITKQPKDYAVTKEDEWATFEVEVSGGIAPYTYYWESNLVEWLNEFHGLNFSDFAKGADTATLAYQADINDLWDSIIFRCTVTDATGAQVISETAGYINAGKIDIIRQPQNVYANPGEKATFKLECKGGIGSIFYYWQVRESEDEEFESLNNYYSVEPYITIKDVTESLEENYTYRCVIEDQMGNVAYSNTVRVVLPMSIQQHPASVYVDKGVTAAYSVQAVNGSGNYSYQWQYTRAGMNGYQNIGAGDSWAKGYNQKQLLVSVNDAIYNGDYAFRCVVTDRESTTIYSNPAQVKRPPLRVVRNPNGRTAVWGEEVVLTVEAKGGKEPYRYIWECAHQGENDFMTVGDNSATLKVGAGHIYGGQANEEFRCIVIDAEGTRVISGNALIRIRKY